MPQQLTQADLAASAARVYALSMGGGTDGQQDMEAWERVVERAEKVLEPDIGEIRFIDFAGLLFGAFRRNWSVEVEFNDTAPVVRAAWEAVARHLANMLDNEDDINVAEHEERWKDWAVRKASSVPQPSGALVAEEAVNGEA